jgi:hypothetical protein
MGGEESLMEYPILNLFRSHSRLSERIEVEPLEIGLNLAGGTSINNASNFQRNTTHASQ